MAEFEQHPLALPRPTNRINTELLSVIASDGTRLAAEEQADATAQALGTVIFVHGYGGNRHEDGGAGDGNGLFDYLAQRTAASGCRVLRYDGRGLGDSGGNFASSTMENHATDFLDVLGFARERYGASERLIVVGFSIGATIVHEATQNNTITRSPEEDAAIGQIVGLSYLAPASPLESMWPRYKELYDKLIERQGRGEENPTILKPGGAIKLGIPSLEMLLTRISPDAFDIDKPLLVCHGTADTRIDIAHTRQRKRNRHNRYGHPFRYEEFVGASHSFKPAEKHWPALADKLIYWYGQLSISS